MRLIHPWAIGLFWGLSTLMPSLVLARHDVPAVVDLDEDGVYDRWDKCGGTPAGRQVDQKGCCDAAIALNKSMNYFAVADPSQAGEGFLATHLQKLYPHPYLEIFINRAKQKFLHTEDAWYVNAGTPKLILDSIPPRGILRWLAVMNAPHTDPPEVAEQILKEYLLTDSLNEYLLTHQLFILEVAKSRGMQFSEGILRRRKMFLTRIHEEQAADTVYGDLYAERALLLFLYEDIPQVEADQWIRVIVQAQDSDGGWTDPRENYVMTYQGMEAKVLPQRPHAAILSAYAIGAYLAKYRNPPMQAPESSAVSILR